MSKVIVGTSPSALLMLRARRLRAIADHLEREARSASPAAPTRAEPAPKQPAADRAARLTPQQRAIANLVARGLSNREIGERLYLSPRTVGSHLYRMFPKLGVHTRSQLAAQWPGWMLAELQQRVDQTGEHLQAPSE